MGMPLKGHGMLGYDGVKKEYVSLWIDSTTTGFMFSSGQGSPDGNSIILNGAMEFPGAPAPMKYRQVWKMVNANSYTFESFDIQPTGEEHRSMLITYTRSKKTAANEGAAGSATGVSPSR
jgi:hypothetical protein